VQSSVNNTEPSRLSADEFAPALERISTLMEPSQGVVPSLYAAVKTNVQESGFTDWANMAVWISKQICQCIAWFR